MESVNGVVELLIAQMSIEIFVSNVLTHLHKATVNGLTLKKNNFKPELLLAIE